MAESLPSKQVVAGSSPVSRSTFQTQNDREQFTKGLLDRFLSSRASGTSPKTLRIYHLALDRFIGYPLTAEGINTYLNSLTCGNAKHNYYRCSNARRKGREVCPSPILPKDKVEGFIIGRIKSYILTEENLEELVRLTNEELYQSCSENRERLELIQVQIEELDSRLSNLYDAIETGEFKSGELAPRIEALSRKKEELLKAKTDVEEILRYEGVDIADPQVVQDYADGLRNLLTKSSITEQRSSLKSFVERIDIDDVEVKVYYTIPTPPYSASEETVGVLPFVHHG